MITWPKALEGLAYICVAVISAIWFTLAFRLFAAPFALALIIGLCFPFVRRHPIGVLCVWLLLFGLTWLPFDVTRISAPDGPKFVRCCPGTPYRDVEATVEKAKLGKCMFCSDVVSGFEPTYYLIW
jgi:hypothetical protein